ncbi:hypothetical protein HMPREF1051_1377 [Neisseria sicca VK64]|uniref:Uncharacterized protein n=1 Tax=Neisseria sicca VK64 TaxID=1095748 RepID=I2NFZ8_NEISI|nr:hypothetical protein HMPREF1051_1377 [Neisseria sicca VK64]
MSGNEWGIYHSYFFQSETFKNTISGNNMNKLNGQHAVGNALSSAWAAL